MSTAVLVLLVLAVAGWLLAGRGFVGWALERQRVADRDQLLDESEAERLQLREWYEREHPERAYQPVGRIVGYRHTSRDGTVSMLDPREVDVVVTPEVARVPRIDRPHRVPGVPRPRSES